MLLSKRNHASNVDQHNMKHRIMVHSNVNRVEDQYSIDLGDTCQMMRAFEMLQEERLVAAVVVENDANEMSSKWEERSLLVVEVVAD